MAKGVCVCVCVRARLRLFMCVCICSGVLESATSLMKQKFGIKAKFSNNIELAAI